jgi:hypothetical protein
LRIARELQPRLILVIGGLVFLLYAYPGLMTVDSVDQLTEARAGFYTDPHPPAMAALWHVLDAIIAGPFLMLLLQGITFLAGTYLVVKRALSPRKAAIAATLVLLFPPVTCTMAFIWKDSLMAGMLALGAGLVMSPCRRARMASLVCFAVASAVKYNAFAATLPLIVLLFEWNPGKRWLVRYALATATWLGVTLGAMGVNAVLVDQPMHFWYSTLAVFDITGVINYEDTLDDEQLRHELAGTGLRVEHKIQEHARAIYATRNMLRLVVGKQRMWNLPTSGRVPAPEAQRDAVGNAWWRMVTEHPAAYLHHRAAFFLSVTGVTYGSFGAVPPRLVTYAGMVDRLEIPQTTFAYQEQWSAFYRWLSVDTPLFRQWLYIVAAILLLPLCRRHRDIAAVLASGLVVEASLFFIAPSTDYRYSHWMIASTCIAVIMLVTQVTSLRGITPTFAIQNVGTE